MKNLILVILSVICAGKLVWLNWKHHYCAQDECDKFVPTKLSEIAVIKPKRCRENFDKILIFSDKKILFQFVANCNELIVLSAPKSIEFKGTSDLPAESVSDVLSATLGYSIDGSQVWDGLFVNDPFNTAKAVVSIVVEGADGLELKVITNLSVNQRNYSIFSVSWFLEIAFIQHRWWRNQLRRCPSQQSHGTQSPRNRRRPDRQS